METHQRKYPIKNRIFNYFFKLNVSKIFIAKPWPGPSFLKTQQTLPFFFQRNLKSLPEVADVLFDTITQERSYNKDIAKCVSIICETT